ncbi:MAG: hypothetical protein MJY87_09790 [Fibrobacter sp.]|nr:hypothetical protein [Fibrobacter sp.]
MARKKKDQEDLDTNIPENDDLPEEETEDIIEEEEEDLGVDELFGNTLGRAGQDIDGWGGGEDYEG